MTLFSTMTTIASTDFESIFELISMSHNKMTILKMLPKKSIFQPNVSCEVSGGKVKVVAFSEKYCRSALIWLV